MDFIIPTLFFIIFCLIVLYFGWFKTSGLKKHILISLLTIKLIGGSCVYIVYHYYYDDYESSDIYKYFRGGGIIYKAKEESINNYLRLVTGIQGNREELQKYKYDTDLWTRKHSYGLYNDDRSIMRFNALIYPISQGNIYTHIVLMSFLSFLGCFALFRSFVNLLPKLNKYLIVFSCFLIPSCLFWTSGLLKEGLMMFSLGFYFYFFVKLITKFNFKNFIGFIFFSSLLTISKIYVLPTMLPALLFMLVSKNMKIKYQIITVISIFLISSLVILFSKHITDYDIIKTIAGKQNDFINVIELKEDKGSSFELTRLDSDLESFIKIIPEGLINSFFKPFIRDIKSPMSLVSFLEIVFFCILTIFAILFFNKPDINSSRFILFSLIFILFSYTLIGIYTPNIGALVRYRTPTLPFLCTLLFCLIDWNKIANRFKYLPMRNSNL